MTADIEIYQGDSIGFNNEKPYKIIINTETDLTGFIAEVFIGEIKQEYPIDDGYFCFLLSNKESEKLSRGQYYLTIKILDTEKRIKTVNTSIRMVVK